MIPLALHKRFPLTDDRQNSPKLTLLVILNPSHLDLQILHGFLKGFGWRPLVVTEKRHGSARSVTREDLLRDELISCNNQHEGGLKSFKHTAKLLNC